MVHDDGLSFGIAKVTDRTTERIFGGKIYSTWGIREGYYSLACLAWVDLRDIP